MKTANGMHTAFILTHESDPQRIEKSISIIALSITRSLGRKGVRVVRVHPNRLDQSLSSRYCSRVEIAPDFYSGEESLLAFLLDMRCCYEGGAVLIPASDDCAYFVAKHHDALSGAFAVMAPRWPVMQAILDKKSQYELAQHLGLPIPETYFPGSGADVRRLAGELLNFPYVIKPLVAHQWRLAAKKSAVQGKKGFAVFSPQELIDRYDTVACVDKNIMIQEVVGGADERLFTFLSYFDEQSRPICYCIRKKVRQHPIDFGYCTLTESCFDATVEAQSIRLLQEIGYHGISGVEWKLDPRTGAYKLIEINPRAVQTIAMGGACGVDIPYLAFRDKTEGVERPVTQWRSGAKWLHMLDDVRAARSLWRLGKLSLWGWWKSIAGKKTHAVYASDDLMPFVGHYLEFFKALMASVRRRLARRTPHRDDQRESLWDDAGVRHCEEAKPTRQSMGLKG